MPTSLCAEFLLTAACSAWPPSQQRTRAIVAAAAQPIDWQRLLRVVARHRVAALVQEGLKSAAVEVPAAVMQTLTRAAADISFQNLAITAECLALQSRFAAAGIAVVFCKGVSLAVLAYDSLALKHGKDIDVLVAVADVPAALRLLSEAGYDLWQPCCALSEPQQRLMLRHGKELALLHRQTGMQVELHWGLVDNPLLLETVSVASPTRCVQVGRDAELRTFTDGDLFAYLCAHGACHGWARLKWLADVAAFLSRNVERIEQLYRSAAQRGAGKCAGQALLLCHQLFATPLPAALAVQLGGDARLRKLASLALRVMAGAYPEREVHQQPFGMARIALARYLLGSGPRYWLRELHRRTLAIPEALCYRLPDWLIWGYGLYCLARIPIWVLRHIREGARALRRQWRHGKSAAAAEHGEHGFR